MRIALLLAMTLATPVFAGQVVWKWVDSQGVTHYADRPVPGAERIELHSGTTTVDTPSPSRNYNNATQPPQATGPAYQTIEIWKPGNDEVLANVGGNVEVSIRVEPDLRAGDTLSLYLDGRLVEGSAGNSQQFTLTEVFRGSHRLEAIITDQRGERVAQSQPVTFHVRQTSILNPQNPQRPNRPR
jgi:hypothetical protein